MSVMIGDVVSHPAQEMNRTGTLNPLVSDPPKSYQPFLLALIMFRVSLSSVRPILSLPSTKQAFSVFRNNGVFRVPRAKTKTPLTTRFFTNPYRSHMQGAPLIRLRAVSWRRVALAAVSTPRNPLRIANRRL